MVMRLSRRGGQGMGPAKWRLKARFKDPLGLTEAQPRFRRGWEWGKCWEARQRGNICNVKLDGRCLLARVMTLSSRRSRDFTSVEWGDEEEVRRGERKKKTEKVFLASQHCESLATHILTNVLLEEFVECLLSTIDHPPQPPPPYPPLLPILYLCLKKKKQTLSHLYRWDKETSRLGKNDLKSWQTMVKFLVTGKRRFGKHHAICYK